MLARTFSIFGTLWVSQGRLFLVVCCKEVPLFLKRWDPRFCTPLQRFSFILQSLGPPMGAKKGKKQLLNYHRFFDVETKAPKLFFIILNSFLRSFDFLSLLVDFWKLFATFLGKCLGDRSGTALGFILDWFCTDFMYMIGVIRIGGTGRKAFTI